MTQLSDLYGGVEHTISSHSDTTASGAELDTLTDNSIADTLHRHTELVASDGSPDPALSIDATGIISTNGQTISINSLGSWANKHNRSLKNKGYQIHCSINP